MKKEARKKELLDIAYKQFVTKGYENTSVDEIIDIAGIAKGTYYYYFESKEQTLDEVVDMLVMDGVNRAQLVIDTDLKLEQKLINVILALRLSKKELSNGDEQDSSNIVFKNKLDEKILSTAISMLTNIVKEGVKTKLFVCNNIEERLRLLVVISNEFFDNSDYSEKYATVYIDTIEKILGAKPGSMKFIKKLLG